MLGLQNDTQSRTSYRQVFLLSYLFLGFSKLFTVFFGIIGLYSDKYRFLLGIYILFFAREIKAGNMVLYLEFEYMDTDLKKFNV